MEQWHILFEEPEKVFYKLNQVFYHKNKAYGNCLRTVEYVSRISWLEV